MRKPRSDSPLKSLTPEIQRQVAELCREHGFARAVEPVRKLTGLARGVSPSALQRWHAWWRVQTTLERQRDEALAFEDLLQGRKDLALDKDRARAVAQLFFERMVLESGDPKLYLAWDKQQLARDRHELAVRQVEEARRAAGDPELSRDPAAAMARIRTIFGLPAGKEAA